MKDLRDDPLLRDLASFAVAFRDHRDIDELHRRGSKLLLEHKSSADLAELAADYQDNDQHRQELFRSAQEVLALPVHPMATTRRRLMGAYIVVLSVVLLAVTPWVWSLASQVTITGSRRVEFLGQPFIATPAMMLLVVVILMAMLGGVTVMALTFASRAGLETLERGFVWWYVTRPLTAAASAVLFYMTVVAGLLDLSSVGQRPALMLAAALAALAGLFTDQVLSKLRNLLGLSAFNETATEKQATQ